MADIVTSRIFTDGEKGITAAKLNDIVASSVIQPAFVSSKPTASTADPADTMLLLKAAGTYAQVPFSTIVSSVNTQLPSSDAEIWSVRLRSFNAVGNPNFEVVQRNVAQAVNPSGSSTFLEDRWSWGQAGTGRVTGQRGTELIVAPGTSFMITNSRFRLTLTTQQPTLGSTDYFTFNQVIEGCALRELYNDVHSLSLLVRSSVANLKFSVQLVDPGLTRSLVKLCTIPTANVLTLIPLPNLPVFPPAGNFSTSPGSAGVSLNICLAAGPNLIAPAADTWQTGNFIGAPGMSNFMASPVNSTFDIAFIQHEPGSVCSTLIDKPFTQNYDECLRYYAKSYNYAERPGTASASSSPAIFNQYAPSSATTFRGYIPFPKGMAKSPTVVAYNPTTGAANSVSDSGAANLGVSTSFSNEKSIAAVVLTAGSSNSNIYLHYTADTGW
jgi:hypothetical protein